MAISKHSNHLPSSRSLMSYSRTNNNSNSSSLVGAVHTSNFRPNSCSRNTNNTDKGTQQEKKCLVVLSLILSTHNLHSITRVRLRAVLYRGGSVRFGTTTPTFNSATSLHLETQILVDSSKLELRCCHCHARWLQLELASLLVLTRLPRSRVHGVVTLELLEHVNVLGITPGCPRCLSSGRL